MRAFPWEKADIGRSARVTVGLLLLHHLLCHFRLLLALVVLHEQPMLARLLSGTFQLLLNDRLIVGHFVQFHRVGVGELVAGLLQDALFAVQRFACLAQFAHFNLIVFQLIGEYCVLCGHPLFVRDLDLAIVLGDDHVRWLWRLRLQIGNKQRHTASARRRNSEVFIECAISENGALKNEIVTYPSRLIMLPSNELPGATVFIWLAFGGICITGICDDFHDCCAFASIGCWPAIPILL